MKNQSNEELEQEVKKAYWFALEQIYETLNPFLHDVNEYEVILEKIENHLRYLTDKLEELNFTEDDNYFLWCRGDNYEENVTNIWMK